MKKVQNRELTVRFNADTASSMTWSFRPQQREIKVRGRGVRGQERDQESEGEGSGERRGFRGQNCRKGAVNSGFQISTLHFS